MTGAASGIGAATTALLRERGHRVITVDRVALGDDHGNDHGGHADHVVADLATGPGREDAVRRVRALADRLDGIVPAAGIAGVSGTDAALLTSVNYFGAVDLVSGLRDLLAGHDSAVVVISSNSTTCQPGWSRALANACLAGDETAARGVAARVPAVLAYPATKAALAWWARRQAVAWARDGIRVNAIAPGLVDTAMTQQVRKDPVFGKYADAYPTALERPGRPEEIAALIGFLLSPDASLLVGSVVYADGGTDAIKHPTWPRGRATGLTSRALGRGLGLISRRRRQH